MRFQMSRLAGLAAAVALAAPASAQLGREPFMIRSTQDLVDLCKADPSDPLYDDAINFCHGFAAGAWQYHEAQANGPKGHRLVCLPEPPPKRADALAQFLTWASAHPEHMKEPAVESLFRFLIEKWPCPEAAATKKGTSK